MNKTEIGILTVLAVTAGSFAYWLYSSLSPEEKRKLENKAVNAANKFLDTVRDLERSAENTIMDIKETVVDK